LSSLNQLCQATPQKHLLRIGQKMAEGTIKRLTDKGFGFIEDGSDKDMFFHSSNLDGVSYEELQEGQRVSYTEGQGPKGPRAENVRPI
jgi:cold shock protein